MTDTQKCKNILDWAKYSPECLYVDFKNLHDMILEWKADIDNRNREGESGKSHAKEKIIQLIKEL